MKKVVAILVTVVMLLSFMVVPACAYGEGEKVEENGFVCERLRDGNLKLIQYKGDAAGKAINIPSAIEGVHIERIGAYAFDGCKAANITIPHTVEVIEAFAFNDCTEIQKISIPNEVYFIDGNPFTGCTGLVNISLDPKHPTLQVTTDGSLYSKRNKMLICYPCSRQDRVFTVKQGTVTIDDYAFYGCDRLESVTLPSSVTEICEGSFCGCTMLREVILPVSLSSIGEMAFAACASLMRISIPRNVSRIEMSTFFNCTSLSSVSFPVNLIKICDRAFYGCSSLGSIRLPASTTTIGDDAFNGCASLTDAYVPVSVTKIGANAFENCSVRLYLHVNEYAFAEIYAKLYDISYTYGNEDSFLIYGD